MTGKEYIEYKLSIGSSRFIANLHKDSRDYLAILLDQFANEKIKELCSKYKYTEREIDLSYIVGVFNVAGIDGLKKEIDRLKGLGKNPHDIILPLQ